MKKNIGREALRKGKGHPLKAIPGPACEKCRNMGVGEKRPYKVFCKKQQVLGTAAKCVEYDDATAGAPRMVGGVTGIMYDRG